MRLVLPLALLALLAGCGRFAPGFIVTDDGRTIANNDQNNREMVISSIRNQLDEQLGGHWRTAVTLPELPVYLSTDSRADYPGGWHWAKATATVELVGDGTATLPMSTASIRQAVLDYLSPKVEHPSRNLAVTVTSVSDAARFAALATPVPTTTTTTATTGAGGIGQRHYTVQAGDTLADISSVFYGSPEHWRRIRDANPGLDAGAMKPGTTLVIPAKP